MRECGSIGSRLLNQGWSQQTIQVGNLNVLSSLAFLERRPQPRFSAAHSECNFPFSERETEMKNKQKGIPGHERDMNKDMRGRGESLKSLNLYSHPTSKDKGGTVGMLVGRDHHSVNC